MPGARRRKGRAGSKTRRPSKPRAGSRSRSQSRSQSRSHSRNRSRAKGNPPAARKLCKACIAYEQGRALTASQGGVNSNNLNKIPAVKRADPKDKMTRGEKMEVAEQSGACDKACGRTRSRSRGHRC